MHKPRASVEALLANIIDYAGLFPPAKLEMGPTVRNYDAYLKSPEQWMLGRLIVPVSRLAEFETHARQAQGDHNVCSVPRRISALTAAAENTDQLATDIAAIEAFNVRHEDGEGLGVIDVIELKADSVDSIESALDVVAPDLFPFFEIPVDRDPRGLIATLVDGDAGAKVRTGGASVPTPGQLAAFIASCGSAHVPFKATAGLHHPLRHFSTSANMEEFGFLNVFVAGVMAGAGILSEREVCELLAEHSIEAFEFDERGTRWRAYRLDCADIAEWRDDFAVSFGSCSFDEPVEDLRRMNLLPCAT